MIAIRSYRDEDLDGLVDLFRQSIRRVAIADYTLAQVLAWAPDAIDRDRFAARRLNRDTWVAEIHSVLAGFADLEPDGHIDLFYVSADHQRRGVAKALYAQIEGKARTLGLSALFTEASKTARPFFQRQGFAVITEQSVPVNGEKLTNYRMEKPLV